MSVNVIITGATGRMGRTLQGAVKADPALNLAGLVVLASELDGAKKEFTGLPVVSDIEELLKKDSQVTIVDFTAPEASLAFARKAAQYGARQVIGTTGLNEAQRAELATLAAKTPIFWSPNMSIGINVLLNVLPQLVKAFGDEYDVEVMEIHHKKKKDSPSGTAVRLGEALAEAKGWEYKDTACYHREGIIGERPQKQIGMQTLRGGDVVGVHTVYFMGPGERIEVTHQAHSRENFAGGAMRAVKWLAGQSAGKLYSMLDVIAK